jgi:CRP/FNR family transcriptional regulator, cyclic AMP receptor protein
MASVSPVWERPLTRFFLFDRSPIMSTISSDDLKDIELVAGFQPEELDQFASQLTVREYAASDEVFSLGDTSRSLYLVLSGRVQIDLLGNVIDETALAELGPREVFGETTFFHAAAHNTTARCLEPTRLAELPYETYDLLLKSNSTLAYHLGANAAHILAARLQATDQWIREVLDHDEELHRRDLRERFHNIFHPAFATPRGFVGLGVNW